MSNIPKKIEESKPTTEYCKDCKGYHQKRCRYWEGQTMAVRKIKGVTHFPIYVARKNSCDNFKRG